MPIGAPELIIILVIALLILGPGKLPEVGASLGKTIREFRKASTDIQESVKVDTSPLPRPAGTAGAESVNGGPAGCPSGSDHPDRDACRRATRAGHGSEPADDRDRRVGCGLER